MFEQTNLFKSINCPYYSQATNTLTCQRPYCQFRHPNVQYLQQQQSQTQQSSSSLSLTEAIKPINDVKPNEKLPETPESKNVQWPTALEKLTDALQAVQELIKKQNSSSSSNTADINLTQLDSISSMFLSTVKSTVSQTSESSPSPSLKRSSSNNLKRQQQLAPAYNPTPINQLKKVKQEKPTSPSSSSQDDLIEVSDLLDNIDEDHLEEEDHGGGDIDDNESENQEDEPLIEEKLEDKSPEVAVKKFKSETSTVVVQQTTTKKCDIVSFSKLSATQQMLKRYELLNKAPPTTATLKDAKLKKQQQEIANAAANAKKPDGPQLIIDASSIGSQARVPIAIRQKYLKTIYDNYVQSMSSSNISVQKLSAKAAQEEKSIYDRSKNKNIYSNLVANLIRSIRTQANTNNSIVSPTKIINKPGMVVAAQASTYSHEAMLSGPKANRVSYSINRVKQIEIKDLSVYQLYQMFYEYVLNEKQLEENSFPKWMNKSDLNSNSKQRLAYIPNFNSTSLLNSQNNSQNKPSTTTSNPSTTKADPDQSKPNTSKINDFYLVKTCKRCNKTFNLIAKDMSYSPNNSECVYHWGKLRNIRFNKSIEQKYSCCSGDLNSEGCEVGKHVYDGDYDGHGTGQNLKDFIEIGDSSNPADLLNSKVSTNVYALDCEMCYTTKGLELTRISIVDLNLKEVYESLVKPDTQILDYNTRWSGLTENSLKNCNKKLKHVQADLMKLLNKDTILIGHSLDSDFKALKLIHKNVIDTSVVFPHKLGHPYKRALRTLMSEYLQKIIQEDAEGHDSKEDANSCIQLMLWKISEDLKIKKLPAFLSNLVQQSSANVNNHPYSSPSIPMNPSISSMSSASIAPRKQPTNSQQKSQTAVLTPAQARAKLTIPIKKTDKNNPLSSASINTSRVPNPNNNTNTSNNSKMSSTSLVNKSNSNFKLINLK